MFASLIKNSYLCNVKRKVMKKNLMTIIVMAAATTAMMAQEQRTLTMPWGEEVSYTAYTDIYYVDNVEDSTYQRMNIFIPDGADDSSPIFMPNGVAGYMAAMPRGVNANEASGRALAEGYVVAIAGARGRSSSVTKDGMTVYTGRAPKGLLDLKAAIRYLRAHIGEYAGNTERIITDGTSAGGAMSSLLGATGNNPAYEAALKAMGAADERDDIYAAVCFCPITDLDHADMAYEWLYGCTNGKGRQLTNEQKAVSDELAAMYPDYINSLGLTAGDFGFKIGLKAGTALTSDNYMDYVKSFIIASAQEAKDAGADIADTLGFTFGGGMGAFAPMDGGMPRDMMHRPQKPEGMPEGGPQDGPQGGPQGRPMGGGPGGGQKGECITGLDMDKYLAYIVSTERLKTPPAFDSKDVAGGRASAENEEFGDETGSSVNFTDYSLRKVSGDSKAAVDEETAENVRQLNPMTMMDEGSTVAPHWYIRHGARDRDTSFPVPVNLATKLQNKGCDVNFKLPWNRPHSGDYALNELFTWIASIVE